MVDREAPLTPPSLRLDGKVAWVTGASRGLGRSLALALAGAGAELLLMARSAEPLRELAAEIDAAGGRALVSAGSVANADDVSAASELAAHEWGRLDVLVNNAGISPAFARAEDLDEHDWRETLEVNLLGPFLCSKAAFPLMLAAGGGSIVNISSVHGSAPLERLLAYGTSKAGLEMLTRTLALEWARHGIRVNAVAPGYLETDMTEGLRGNERLRGELLGRIPLGRFANPAEMATAVLFLAGEASAYCTGSTITADGGWSAR